MQADKPVRPALYVEIDKLKAELAAARAQLFHAEASTASDYRRIRQAERERDEARACLREAMDNAEHCAHCMPVYGTWLRWRKSAGMEA